MQTPKSGLHNSFKVRDEKFVRKKSLQHQQKYQLTLKYRVHQSFIDELKCSNGILAYAQCLVFHGNN